MIFILVTYIRYKILIILYFRCTGKNKFFNFFKFKKGIDALYVHNIPDYFSNLEKYYNKSLEKIFFSQKKYLI